MREITTTSGKFEFRLLEDLTALVARWLHVNSLQRTFALDIPEFILSNYVVMFKILVPYEQMLSDGEQVRRLDQIYSDMEYGKVASHTSIERQGTPVVNGDLNPKNVLPDEAKVAVTHEDDFGIA
ncbi:hypothetical protein V6N11_029077 [Hibiscus sabdariffa]|uniref:Uncharacterized protein n=2 Tax=Hibiscus sabdariffa TaxID=183260 RepID=A0ABR1Z7C6_9ROSI